MSRKSYFKIFTNYNISTYDMDVRKSNREEITLYYRCTKNVKRKPYWTRQLQNGWRTTKIDFHQSILTDEFIIDRWIWQINRMLCIFPIDVRCEQAKFSKIFVGMFGGFLVLSHKCKYEIYLSTMNSFVSILWFSHWIFDEISFRHRSSLSCLYRTTFLDSLNRFTKFGVTFVNAVALIFAARVITPIHFGAEAWWMKL